MENELAPDGRDTNSSVVQSGVAAGSMPRSTNSPYPIATDAFLAAVIESSEDAILTKDLNGIITSWNPGARRLFGYEPEEVIGKRGTMLFPPDRVNEEAMIFERIRRGERVDHYETVRRTKTGELIEVSLTISPIRTEDGTIVGSSKIARDLRARNRAELQFRTTLASIGDAVIATDRAGDVTFMNSVAEQMTGWPLAEALGLPLDQVFRIVSEDHQAPVESPVAKVLREGTIVGLANHTLLISRDGKSRPVDDSAAPIRTSTGDLIGVVLVFRDVSDRRASHLAATRLAAIVEGSHDAIISKDLSGTITSWNSAAERTFGYKAEEMIGRHISVLFPPERLDEEPFIIARLQRGERVDHFETVRVRKDGTRINVSLAISPIRDEDGTIIGASKIARDITPQKNAERALQEAQQQLAQHAASLEEKVRERTAELERLAGEAQAFSYSLSHDIRAPLRAIQGFTEAVISDYGARIPEGVEYLQRVVRAAERMDRLLADVLAFSRVSQAAIDLEPVDLGLLIRDLIAERPHLQSPATELKLVEPLGRVSGNPASLTQAIGNLLENAVKFVRPGVRPLVRVYTMRVADRVRVCVEDNGIGIKPGDQQRLFSVFNRLHTPGIKYEGTGLGLAIVRRAAERMGGTAGVSSQPGIGSTFWIELKPAPKGS